MRILIPITNFGHGGGGRVLSRLASAWTAAGHPTDFLVDARSPKPYFPTDAGVHRFDERGLVDGPAPDESAFASSGNGLSIYQGMYHGLNQIGTNYDVILANHSLTAWPVRFARAGNARKFYYVQAYEPEYFALESGWKSKVLRRFSEWSYSLALHQIANAPIYVGHRSIRATSWIPPGLDVSVFHRRSAIPHFSDRDTPIVIGTIGRKEATKGTIHVLEAFTRLHALDPRFRLRVAFGNLPDGWAQRPGIEVVAPRGDAELAAYYRSVDILAAPGTVQLGACHYPVLEAMASGTPVVTTGYLPASADNSWLVPVRDSDAVADAILNIVATPAHELERRLDLAHSAVQRFSWQQVAKDFLDQFSNAAKLSHD
ncbi:glycosyltransferase family 4 protein [Roseateles sp. DXS20W]|uniref:Glycosyltransferase family 4 protein n=1 Tax=Pelomonas lactea TaxID=3299030 RepID=A0ABW7GI37_9BURK